MRLLLMLVPLALVLLLAGSARAAPNVTLVAPANGNVSQVTTGFTDYQFNCSASSTEELANISLWINSTGNWSQNQTASVTGTWNYSTFNLSLGPGQYIWNCLAGDNTSNYTFASENWTLFVNNVTDATPPNVSLESPADGNQSSTTTFVDYTFNCSAYDGVQLANISLWINSTGNWSQNQTASVTGMWNFSIFSLSLGPGQYIWGCRAGDNSSNYAFASANRTINVSVADVTPADVWFASPAGNGTILNRSWIYVNVSASEGLNASLLDWYNGTWQNMSMSVNGTMSWVNMTGLQDGSYYFRVYANDSAGNWNVTDDRQASVDATYPQVGINSPANGTNYSSENLTLSFAYNETNPHTCWYAYNGSNVTLPNCTAANFTGLDHQTSLLSVWMNDTAGNANASEIIFSVCTESWTCTGWSACSGSSQTRSCSDSYTCGTTASKPAESQGCTPQTVGSSGGGGGIDLTVQAYQKWETLTPGQEFSMGIEKAGLELSRISITVSNESRGASITVTKLDGRPGGIPADPGKVYQYVNVSASGLQSLRSAAIEFRVAKFWISGNNIDRRKVYLNRFAPLAGGGSGWARLNTSILREDDSSVFYYSLSPGFSYFAITGEALVQSAPEENVSAGCNNNNLCESGENEACPDCAQAVQQCTKGSVRCRSGLLQECWDSGQWVVTEECEHGCLEDACREVQKGNGMIAAIVVVISGIIAYALGITIWRKKISPYRYFRF